MLGTFIRGGHGGDGDDPNWNQNKLGKETDPDEHPELFEVTLLLRHCPLSSLMIIRALLCLTLLQEEDEEETPVTSRTSRTTFRSTLGPLHMHTQVPFAYNNVLKPYKNRTSHQ